jgi:hypothetical protein
MSAPFHVQIYCRNDTIFRGFFYHCPGEGFELFLKNEESGKETYGGKWPKIVEADEWAKLLMDEATQRVAAEIDPLAKYRGDGYQLLATFDSLDHRWAVIAGNRKSGRFEDTRARFSSREEAKGAIGCLP